MLCFVSFLCIAQEPVNDESIFLRVYNLEGKKIANAYLVNIDDSGLYVEVKDSLQLIPIAKIGKIKTKKSFGGNVLFGSLIGTTLGLALIVGDAETGRSSVYSGEERIVAVAGGMFIGAAVGLGTGLFKNSKVYQINGNAEVFQQFKKMFKPAVEEETVSISKDG
ncbi:MAG: hypothetical protein AB8B52_13055 [Winogradskyella sp.]|uniref:hypothetical protein n=1 Tax=Winogradskyella sp. TaxID=1883156 RepID=UPI00385CDA23